MEALTIDQQVDARTRLPTQNDFATGAAFAADGETGHGLKDVGAVLRRDRLRRSLGVDDDFERFFAQSR
jgi:hypothetical protein